MRLPKFEEEVIAEIDRIRNQKQERGVVECQCCERYFSSGDKKRIRTCPICKPHALTRGSLGCPTRLTELGGVSLCRRKPDPSHASNDHLFNAKFKDRRRRHEEIPEEEELDDLLEEDLGVKMRMDRDE